MTADDLVTKHRATLAGALTAIRDRGYWSAYPESARAYGEDGEVSGRAAFDAYLGTSFPLDQPGTDGTVSTERSPYGIDLAVSYPRVTADTVDGLVAAAQAGMPGLA